MTEPELIVYLDELAEIDEELFQLIMAEVEDAEDREEDEDYYAEPISS